MTRVLRYILQTDSGMAPCVDSGLVSLATCKPRIRRGAEPGEWVVGCRPSPAPRGLVVWAGCVMRKSEVGEYERTHRGRKDAVYRMTQNGEFKRLRPDYHADDEEMRKDLSAPVLLFDPAATWYFGSEPHMMPEHLMHLAAGGRGHRVGGVNDGDATMLQSWLESTGPAGVHGRPRDFASAMQRQKCNRMAHGGR